MTTKEIADRLVSYCRQAKFEDAQRELYSTQAISLEPEDTPMGPKETKGLTAIIEKGRMFTSMLDRVHSMTVSEPVVSTSSFACVMSLDADMKGRGRTSITELCVYEVKGGKIVLEQFRP
jgi:hypothetical protein